MSLLANLPSWRPAQQGSSSSSSRSDVGVNVADDMSDDKLLYPQQQGWQQQQSLGTVLLRDGPEISVTAEEEQSRRLRRFGLYIATNNEANPPPDQDLQPDETGLLVRHLAAMSASLSSASQSRSTAATATATATATAIATAHAVHATGSATSAVRQPHNTTARSTEGSPQRKRLHGVSSDDDEAEKRKLKTARRSLTSQRN